MTGSCPGKMAAADFGLFVLVMSSAAVSANIFEPPSPLNIVPGRLESEVFESTDSEILRRDLFNENWDSNDVDTVYSGPGRKKLQNAELCRHLETW